MIRSISHTEIQTAMDCYAKHAFAYTGAMTDGTALSAKRTAPLLIEGKAWGAGVAAWHQFGRGYGPMLAELADDAEQQRELGLFDEQHYAEVCARLSRMLDHYTQMAGARLNLRDTERELMVAIPSRKGIRGSTRFRLQCFLDGVVKDELGRYWIVEFKLRNRLQTDEMISLSRQIRWYAWAWAKSTGNEPAGVIVDERLNALPADVRINKDGTPSKQQSCLPAAYEQACVDAGHEPDADVLSQLRAKVWQKRTTVMFRGSELEEVGWQLTTAANLIRQLDSGVLYPIRNPSPSRCPNCQFKEICPQPDDTALVDSLFNRVLPKWERNLLEEAA